MLNEHYDTRSTCRTPAYQLRDGVSLLRAVVTSGISPQPLPWFRDDQRMDLFGREVCETRSINPRWRKRGCKHGQSIDLKYNTMAEIALLSEDDASRYSTHDGSNSEDVRTESTQIFIYQLTMLCSSKLNLMSPRIALMPAECIRAAGVGVGQTASGLSRAGTFHASRQRGRRTAGSCGIASNVRRTASPRHRAPGHTWPPSIRL